MTISPSISVVIPAFNEAPVIGRVIKEVKGVLDEIGKHYEILVVDDGSTDGTAKAAEEAGATVYRHPYNIGNGAAVKRGIRSAAGDVIILMDGDGQHSPKDIPRLLQAIPPYEMVVGARSAESETTFHRDVANKIYNVLASYIVGRKVEDLTSGFRAIDASVAKRFACLFPNGFSYPSTITISMFRGGHTVKYIPIKASARVGKSKIRIIRDGFKFLLILVRIGTLFAPLRVFLPLGALIFLPGVLMALYKLAAGKAWTLPVVISITGGLLIFAMGLISEQIALLRIKQTE